MYYSEDIIEEVFARNDIADVVGMYVHLTKKGANYWGLCPFHGEKTPSFSVNTNKQMFYCFGCHKGGSVITFLMEYENLTFPEAVQELAARSGIKLPDVKETEEDKRKRNEKEQLLEINKAAAAFFYSVGKSERGKPAMEYFKKRCLTEESIRHWGLGYSLPVSGDLYAFLKSKGFRDEAIAKSGLVNFNERGATDRFWNRVIFPIMNESDKVIGFGGRVMGTGEPKYLNSAENIIFDKGINLYGLNYAKRSGKKYFLLCGGYMDVISLHQAGFTNAVASLGTALTERNALKIKKYVNTVYLTYDSDGAGTDATLRAIRLLGDLDVTVKVVDMRPHKDPDEFIKALGAEEYQKRIDNAESSFYFEMRIIESRYKMDDPKEKNDYYVAVARRLLEFTNELERKTYEDAYVARYNVDPKKFHELLIKTAQKESPKRSSYRAYENTEKAPGRTFEETAGKKKDDLINRAQRLLLTYLSDDPGLYEKISAHLSPSDFTEGIYRKIAETAFRTISESGTINPNMIVSLFEEKEEQEEAGAIFNTALPGEEEGVERTKAISDIIVKIKCHSLDRQMDAAMDSGDTAAFTELLMRSKEYRDNKVRIF